MIFLLWRDSTMYTKYTKTVHQAAMMSRFV